MSAPNAKGSDLPQPVEFKSENFSPFRKFWQMFSGRVIEIYPFSFRYKLHISGRENIPAREQFVIVANHLSSWDPPLLVVAVRRPMGFLAKIELYRDPKFAKLIEIYGAISINREKLDVSTVKSVKKIFKAGWSLTMFIEGTRSQTPGVFGRPHLGPAYFARCNKVRILPVGIVGSNVKGGDVYVRIGEPLDYGLDLEQTTWQIMESLAELTGFKIVHRELAQSIVD